MVLSLITLAATVPLIATSTIQLQEQSQRKQQEGELEAKTEKCHLAARATKRMSPYRHEQLQNMQVVLRDGFLYLEPKTSSTCHPFSGYFLPYPNKDYDGIVTTINSDNMLNWIFIDPNTHRLRYGVRAEAESQWTGPMSLVFGEDPDESRIAFNGWEGFVVTPADSQDSWAIYFDKDDDGLAALNVQHDVVVEIELVRSKLESSGPSTEDPD